MNHRLSASSRVVLALLALPCMAGAQIRVNPTGVSTNAMGATTVFLTFGRLLNQVPVEALWCGEVLPAVAPDRGTRCDPATVYGRLPLRSNLARVDGRGVLTDIMSIPASIARRAYQDAMRGQRGTFFYVRRFQSTTGGPDEFVSVTCRLTGGGAYVPFSLTNVSVSFDSKTPVELVPSGATLPPAVARIAYNGTGRLRGRWEVVMPGEELPVASDLLTESSIPPEQRGRQRRYAQVERFNVLLPPGSGGSFELPGPDPSRLPTLADGAYFLLLRIESTDDRSSDSDLGAANAGTGVLHNGAVAGFPMPTLRYVVGAATVSSIPASSSQFVRLASPLGGQVVPSDSILAVRWVLDVSAAFQRIEFQGADGDELLTAIVRTAVRSYEVPPQVAERANGRKVKWRVSALDGDARLLRRSAWAEFRFAAGNPQ